MSAQAQLSSPARARLIRPSQSQDILVDSARQFAELARPAQKDIGAFKELFYNLIFRANLNTKKGLSVALSRSHYTPRTIAIFLAMEEIEIAAPMLLFSPALTSRDINSVIEKCSLQHMRVLARRANLAIANVEKLLEFKDERNLIRSLLKQNSSLQANQEIMDLLAGNPGINQRTVTEKTYERKPPAQPVKRTEPAAPAPAETAARKLLELANVGGKLSSRRSQVTGFYTEITGAQEKQLLESARNGNHPAFAEDIHAICGLQQEETLDIIKTANAGKLASLLRAVGVSKLTASQLLLLLNAKVGRNISVFREITQQYERLHKSECQAYFAALGATFAMPAPQEGRATENSVDFDLSLNARREAFTKRGDSSSVGGDVEAPLRQAG